MAETRPVTDGRMLTTLDEIDKYDDAIAFLDANIATDPNDFLAHYNKALILLSAGRLAEGWREHDWRMSKGSQIVRSSLFPVPKFTGGLPYGQHVLVWLEHGIGDQILAASMLPDIIAVAASVTVLCHRRLADLFRRSFPTITVIKYGEPEPERYRSFDYDCQMSISDMGAVCRYRMDMFPPRAAFLKTGTDIRARYYQGKPVIGVAWHSGKNPKVGQYKSVPVGILAQALFGIDATFVNLQYGENAADLAALSNIGIKLITDPAIDQLADMDSYTSQVAAMDAVITCSNTTAHVAGALGIPTAVLLPRTTAGHHARHWYWHNERSDSPWYPSLTLFRQATPGDWGSAISGAGSWLESQIETEARSVA